MATGELRERLDRRDNGLVVLDVRERAAFDVDHIPGARNLPYGKLLNKDGTLKSPREIERLFEEADVDLGKPVVTSCGSGITAAALALALAQTGHRKTAVYDGSWAEWGADQSLPIETGSD